MRPKDSVRDPSTDISALRQMVEHATQQARTFAERYEKNTGIQECLIFMQRALAAISDEDDPWPEPVNLDWTEFGKTLKHRRQQARLGQKEVADLVDVSESMIRSVEAAQKRPSRKLLLRLLALPALNLNLDDLVSPTDQDGVIPTLWLAPHYDPHQLITELIERLNGSGCSLSQGYLSRLKAGEKGAPGAPLVSLLALLAAHPNLVGELEDFWTMPPDS